MKILDNMYLKMLSYSLGNGTKGIFLLSVISKLYKISITQLLLAFMKYFFLLFSKATFFLLTRISSFCP